MRKIALMATLALSLAACGPKPEPTNTINAMQDFTRQQDNELNSEQARTNAAVEAGAQAAMNGIPASSPITRAVNADTGCNSTATNGAAPCR